MKRERGGAPAIRRLLYAAAAISLACGVPENHAKSWEGLHQAKFLPGYVDYRGEADGTEDGYVIMSFGLPSSLTPEAAIKATVTHFNGRFPCYKPLQQTPTSVVLRCPGGQPRHGGMLDEEYEFLVRPESRRVFILVLDRVQRADYERFGPLLQEYAGR